MSPSRGKSENELGSLTLIPVDTVVITKLSCYLAQPPSCVKRASDPMLQGVVAGPGHMVARREVRREQLPRHISGTGQWL